MALTGHLETVTTVRFMASNFATWSSSIGQLRKLTEYQNIRVGIDPVLQFLLST